jgi:hypothetical protein
MMSFATLTGAKSVDGSIKSWMNYSRIDAEGILEEAQAMIYGRLRVREMRASDQFTVRVGASSVDEPDGLLDAILFWDITNDVEICSKEDSDLERMRSWTDGVLDDGDPAYYALYDELINFDCKTTIQWRLRTLFYKQPDYLADSNPTNFLTKRYPHLLRMACLATGARFNDDEARFTREQQLLFAEISNIAVEDEMGRSTDVPVRM